MKISLEHVAFLVSYLQVMRLVTYTIRVLLQYLFYIILWFGLKRFTKLSAAKMTMSLELNHTFVSEDNFFKVFILVRSIALGPC